MTPDWLHNYSCFTAIATLFAIIAYRRCPPWRWLQVPYLFLQWPAVELAWFFAGVQASVFFYAQYLGAWQWLQGNLSSLLLLLVIASFWRLLQRGLNEHQYLNQVLKNALGNAFLEKIPAQRRALLRQRVAAASWLKALKMKQAGVKVKSNIAYGEHPRHRLDIYRPDASDHQKRPVLLQIHGGGWVIGHKKQQAMPLINHMASHGWLVVSINYRLSPSARFPDHIVDVKRALVWLKDHIAEYGGDPDFICVTGGSAGGHLASLLALTDNLPALQPGFESADTSVQACVPFYGVYDFLDRNNIRGHLEMKSFLSSYVMPGSPEQYLDLWQQISPINHVKADAVPMMVVHGSYDSLVYVEEAQAFVAALRATTLQPLVYAELKGAQHAFEVTHSPRTEHTINAVQQFLEYCYAGYLQPLQNKQP